METHLPCKTWETQFMWLRASIFFPEFLGLSRVNVTGFGLPRVSEIANIGIIYDSCNHMRPLAQLKQVNAKHNYNTALKHRNVKNRACYPFNPVPYNKTTIGDIY